MREIIYKIQKWFHDTPPFYWAFPISERQIGGDGFQPTYLCKYCDFEITQDSTGAWFHLSN